MHDNKLHYFKNFLVNKQSSLSNLFRESRIDALIKDGSVNTTKQLFLKDPYLLWFACAFH